MRLVTFEDAGERRRIGALAEGDRIVDLEAAYALYLRESAATGRFKQLPGSAVPGNMRQLFEAGDEGLEAARKALELVLKNKTKARLLRKPLFYRRADVKLKAPILPKKFFHTAGNFREHHKEAEKAGFSHPVLDRKSVV